MANEHKIDINKRESLGKKGVKQLRREGMIPEYIIPQTLKALCQLLSPREIFMKL